MGRKRTDGKDADAHRTPLPCTQPISTYAHGSPAPHRRSGRRPVSNFQRLVATDTPIARGLDMGRKVSRVHIGDRRDDSRTDEQKRRGRASTPAGQRVPDCRRRLVGERNSRHRFACSVSDRGTCMQSHRQAAAASIWEHAVRDFRCPMSGVNRRITMNTQRSGHKDEAQRDKKTTERSPHSGQKDEGSRGKHEARQEPKEQNRPTERRS